MDGWTDYIPRSPVLLVSLFCSDPGDTRLEDDWQPDADDDDAKDPAEAEKEMRAKEAKSHAEVLEMIGDLPDAEIKPPENVLFVCKLNPVTNDEDLEIIFSR